MTLKVFFLPRKIFLARQTINTVITGFNTDIKHEGVTYHVQTEDKGLKTPLILSLVYEGGTILASKRSPYEDLVADFDEKVLEGRLNRQHSLICAAIRAGRIEDLKRMTLEASSSKQKEAQQSVLKNNILTNKGNVFDNTVKNKVPQIPKTDAVTLIEEKELKTILPEEKNSEVKLPANTLEIAETELEPKKAADSDVTQKIVKNITEPDDSKPFVEQIIEPEIPRPIAIGRLESEALDQKLDGEPEFAEPIIEEQQLRSEIPKPFEETVWDIPIIEDVTIIEDKDINAEDIVATEIILPPDAVEIIGDLEQFGSLLEDELKVKILGDDPFKSGDRKNINILVCRGSENLAVADAGIIVKVIGSAFRPLIYHAKADSNGIATVFLKLPEFRSGRAALLIRAMVDGEETELRRAISST